MKIAVLAKPTDWHFCDLKRASAQTNCVLTAIDYCSFGVTLDSSVNQIVATDIERAEPIRLDEFDCIIVRAMPAGSLQQVVFRMDLLGQLARQGTVIVNSPKTIEASVDKYLSLELLRTNDLPVPRTAVCESLSDATRHFDSFGNDAIVKPIFGSSGRGIIHLNEFESAKEQFADRIDAGEVIYLQERLATGNTDYRMLAIGERIIAMKRHNPNDWITNATRGSTCSAHEPSEIERDLAIRAAKAVGGQIIGVDIAYDQDCNPHILEVNASPGWKELSRVSKMDIALEFLKQCQSAIAQY